MTKNTFRIVLPYKDHEVQNTMNVNTVNKNLLLLKETILANLYEKIKNDREIIEEANEILIAASTMIENARNEQELIAVYETIVIQLEIVSEDCESLGNTKLGYIQRKISDALRECIKPYLPHNVSRSDLIKILWPHNCWDISALKNVFLNYIFENALMLGVDDIFMDNFIAKHKVKIKKAKKLRQLISVYEDIKEDARLAVLEYYKQGNHENAWKYGVLSRVIGFLMSDFEHCLSAPTGTFKWFGSSSVYL